MKSELIEHEVPGRVRRAIAVAFLVVLVSVSSIVLVAGTASAQGANVPLPVTWLAQAAIYVMIGFVVVGVIAVVLYLAEKKDLAVPAAIVAGVLLALSVGGFIAGMVIQGGGVDCNANPTDPACRPIAGYVAIWAGIWGGSSTIAGGAQAPHDAATEFPTAPFTVTCSGTTPAGTIPSLATSVFSEDNTTNSATLRVTITAGANHASNAAYQTPDCDAPDIRLTLTNPPSAAAGGLQAVPFWGRISVTRLSTSGSNVSYTDVFWCDQNAGIYLGWGMDADSGSNTHSTNHRYVSYVQNIKSCPASNYPLQGDWIQLGTTSTSTPGNGEWIAPWFVLRQGGPFWYSDQPSGTKLSLKFEVGTSPGNAAGWQGNIVQFNYDITKN